MKQENIIYNFFIREIIRNFTFQLNDIKIKIKQTLKNKIMKKTIVSIETSWDFREWPSFVVKTEKGIMEDTIKKIIYDLYPEYTDETKWDGMSVLRHLNQNKIWVYDVTVLPKETEEVESGEDFFEV